ncbi:Myb protein j, partial [Globisporangium splendens]
MTISKRIRNQLFASKPAVVLSSPVAPDNEADKQLIRLPLTYSRHGVSKRASRANKKPAVRHSGLGWTDEEHERFLQGLELFPTGPWKQVAAYVGTRTTRQTMTHAQKYRQKIERRQRGLMIPVRKPASIAGTAAVTRKATPVATNNNDQGQSDDSETCQPTAPSKSPSALNSSSTASSPSSAEQLVREIDFDLDFLDVNGKIQADPLWFQTPSLSHSEAMSIVMGEDEQGLIPLHLDETMRCSLMTDVHDPIVAMFEDPSNYLAIETWQQQQLQQRLAPNAPWRPTISTTPTSTDVIYDMLPSPYEFYF